MSEQKDKPLVFQNDSIEIRCNPEYLSLHELDAVIEAIKASLDIAYALQAQDKAQQQHQEALNKNLQQEETE